MPSHEFFAKYEKAFIAVVFAFAVAVVFVNLGAVALWHDEGANATMARQLVNTGGFGGFTGRNLFVGLNGTALDADLGIAAFPPGPAFPSALGIALFGETPFGLRFFHAVFGALSLLLFAALLRLDFGSAQMSRLRVFAFVCFALSTQALLFMRQGRYYADAFLFSLLAFYCYRAYWLGACRNAQAGGAALAKVPPAAWLALCAVATFLNFANHYAIGAAFAAAMAAWHLLFCARQTTLRHYAGFAVAGAAVAGACALLLWQMGVLGGGKKLEFDSDSYNFSWQKRRLVLLHYYFRDLLRYGWLPLWVALWLAAEAAWALGGARAFPLLRRAWQNRGGGIFAAIARELNNRGKKRKAKAEAAEAAAKAAVTNPEMRAVWRYLALALLFFLVSSLISVQAPSKHPYLDSRYVVPALPFLALVWGGLLCRLASLPLGWGAPATGIAAATLLLSNLPTQPYSHPNLFTQERLFLTLPRLLAEVSRPRPTATQEAADFLRDAAAQDDTVYVRPWQDRDVLLFYLDDKLIFCCDLNADSGFDKAKIDALNIPAYQNAALPRWLVTFDGSQDKSGNYKLVFSSSVYPYPTRRPEIEMRTFEPLLREPRAYIFRLKEGAEAAAGGGEKAVK